MKDKARPADSGKHLRDSDVALFLRAVHGDAGGLVEHEQVVILPDNRGWNASGKAKSLVYSIRQTDRQGVACCRMIHCANWNAVFQDSARYLFLVRDQSAGHMQRSLQQKTDRLSVLLHSDHKGNGSHMYSPESLRNAMFQVSQPVLCAAHRSFRI